MVDIMDVNKSLNISIRTVMKIPEMLYRSSYVPDEYKTRQICDKAILENDETLKSVPDCYKNQEMCNKAVDNYTDALEFVPECYKTQKKCDKAVNTYPCTIKFVPECVMTQEMYHKAVNRYFLCYFLFLINIKLKKCVTELFLMILF